MEIHKIVASRRRDVLVELLSRKFRVSELARKLSMSKPSVSQYVSELQKIGMINKKHEIELTNVGRILVEQFQFLERNYSFLCKEAEFWNQYDLSNIPKSLQHRLFELNNCEIVRSGKGEVMKHIQFFCSELLNAQFAKVASSVVYPEWVFTISRVCKKVDVSLILSDDAFNTLSRDYSPQLETIIDRANVFMSKNLKLLCLVTNSALCLGLHLKNGEFDIKCGLISRGKSAVRWGLELFTMLRERSTPVS